MFLYVNDEPKNMGDNKFPSSCSDLNLLVPHHTNLLFHTLNGTYLTNLDKNSNKKAAVFCEFTPSLTGFIGDPCSGEKYNL